jgi:kinetochore protein Nuf2
MASGFGFPILSTAKIAKGLLHFGIAPAANLRPEDIAKPQPDLLLAVLCRFLVVPALVKKKLLILVPNPK